MVFRSPTKPLQPPPLLLPLGNGVSSTANKAVTTTTASVTAALVSSTANESSLVSYPHTTQASLVQSSNAGTLIVPTNTTTTTTTALAVLTQAANSAQQSATSCGMERYIKITKRKRSPEQVKNNNKIKKNISTNCNSNVASHNAQNNNRFAILANQSDNEASSSNQASKEFKPPPIYVRERSSNAFVANLTRLVGNGNFYIVPLTRGNLHETKIQVKSESHFRIVIQDLKANNKNYYTYQLKSSKGISVVIKGIESDVDPEEIKNALGEMGFHARAVINIVNKNKVSQPMFKVDLLPGLNNLKKNEAHPIYKLQFLLHRRITVEPPHPRNGPVQCSNCQEFGHTRTYCTLRPVCVACGEKHRTSECQEKVPKDKNVVKCGNCGDNHTANYRGCPVYQHLKRNIALQRQTLRNPNKNPFVPVDVTPQRFVVPGVSFANVLKENTSNQQQADQSGSNLEKVLTQFMQTMQTMFGKIIEMQSQLITLLTKK